MRTRMPETIPDRVSNAGPERPRNNRRTRVAHAVTILREFLEDELDRRRDSGIREYIYSAEQALSALDTLENES
jgi:hypothetical protein